MTATVTTVTFKRIKDYVLGLKEKPDRKGVLLNPAALRKQLQVTDKDWRFTDAEMMTAVGHLETHGYVTVSHSSAGEQHILLTPDLLASLVASIVLLADKNPRELGAVSETKLLAVGETKLLAVSEVELFDELKGLEEPEQQILLDAAILRFLQHNLCFRETLGNDTLLIFPGLIKQKRPLQDEFASVDDVSYIVRGRVENLYAALVVLLGYTSAFTRINQWQNQAQYEMGAGEICGFRLTEEREGELELVLYYSTAMPAYGRTLFQGLFESFLYKRDVEVTRFPPVFCANKHRFERTSVIKRVREGKDFIFKAFQARGVTIVRDQRDIGFKGNIKSFMQDLGQGKAVVLVISEKYLKSPNCCFELVQVAKHGDFADRIFPIVLADAKIYDPAERGRFIEHWEKKKDELDEVMKRVSAANMEGFREDIDLYAEIRALLPKLIDVLKNMNALTPEIHQRSGFSEIFGAVMAKLEE